MKIRRLICIVLLLTITITLQDGNIKVYGQNNNQTTSTETRVEGSVIPTLIKVSAPSVVYFSINPNAEDAELRFASSNIAIKNESSAAVQVKISRGASNFALLDTSKWKPINTEPDKYDWDNLDKNQSESYIALGVRVGGGNWKTTFKTTPLYVIQQSSSSSDTKFGNVKNKSTANMSLVCNHGLSFSEAKECSYRIVWTFSLAD